MYLFVSWRFRICWNLYLNLRSEGTIVHVEKIVIRAERKEVFRLANGISLPVYRNPWHLANLTPSVMATSVNSKAPMQVESMRGTFLLSRKFQMLRPKGTMPPANATKFRDLWNAFPATGPFPKTSRSSQFGSSPTFPISTTLIVLCLIATHSLLLVPLPLQVCSKIPNAWPDTPQDDKWVWEGMTAAEEDLDEGTAEAGSDHDGNRDNEENEEDEDAQDYQQRKRSRTRWAPSARIP